MKIAIYGISCAGKDTFIDEFVKRFPNFSHIKGSSKLNEISLEKTGCPFREIGYQEQESIREEFVKRLENTDNIIVDGHYCFPEEKAYRIAFTDGDKELYDAFFYLRAIPAMAKERISKSQKNIKYSLLNEKDLENWQFKEISDLRDMCFENKKGFIVLDENFEEDFIFLSEYLSTFPKMHAVYTANKIVERIMLSVPGIKKIALFDCDRTITQEDATIPFFEINKAPVGLLRKIFYGDVYTVYQFWRQKKIYKTFSSFPQMKEFTINQQIVNKLNELKGCGYTIFGLTAGIYKIWNGINEKEGLFAQVIGEDLSKESDGIVTDFVKGYIARFLLEKGYSVFSTGDSMCDIYMLESCGGYIWAPGKTRPIVQKYINEHKKTTILQYKNNPVKYEGIGVAE